MAYGLYCNVSGPAQSAVGSSSRLHCLQPVPTKQNPQAQGSFSIQGLGFDEIDFRGVKEGSRLKHALTWHQLP